MAVTIRIPAWGDSGVPLGADALGRGQGFSAGPVTALSPLESVLEVTGDHAAPAVTDALAEDVPDACRLGVLHLQFDSLAGGAGHVTVYLALDAAGDHPLTAERTLPIVAGTATATDGGAALLLEGVPYRVTDVGTSGSLFVVASLDAGTANCLARLFWEA